MTRHSTERQTKELFIELELERSHTDTSTGFLICSGIAARTGIQPYSKEELDPSVNPTSGYNAVYRDVSYLKAMAAEFSKGTFPITDEHHFVEDGQNLNKIIGWVTSAEVVKTSEESAYLIVHMTLFAPHIISRVKEGDAPVGLSIGYYSNTKIVDERSWTDTDGVVGAKGAAYTYRLVVTDPKVNHLATCGLGRAGLATQIYKDALTALTDQQKNYPYPTEDNSTTMDEKRLQEILDGFSSKLADAMSKQADGYKSMCDAIGPAVSSALYGSFGSSEFQALIAQQYARDKKGADPEEQATQRNIMETAEAHGFYKDSAEFGTAVMDSLKVWKELGSEAANLEGINEASTGEQIRRAWIASKGIQLSDSASINDVNAIYDGLRAQVQEKATPKATAVKGFFDSINAAPTKSVASDIDGVQATADGGAIYF